MYAMLNPVLLSRLPFIIISRSMRHTLLSTSKRTALPPCAIVAPSYSMAFTQQSTTSLMPEISTRP